jgi:cellulose synthase/poly-beta-1,6-N-acetylglucosamine synthase-like glycosyltransferase
MTGKTNDIQHAVDVVIPVYGEREEALTATLSACVKQTYPINRIIVVDDGSAESIRLPVWAEASPQVFLLRLSENQGISVARNAGISDSSAPLIACINTEVLPDPDWLAVCVAYLLSRPRLGACYARLVSATPHRLLTRWRMRFLETKFGEESGPSSFAPGHAVFFRREAIEAVSGYDPHFRLHHEDSDICHRMRKLGWETHYVADSRCVSIQQDSLMQLVGKVLRETGWYSPSDGSLARLYFHHTKWTLVRAGRNLVKGRISFLPVDAAIWICGLWTATSRTLRYARRERPAKQTKIQS